MLKQGDLVDLVAPASGFNRSEYEGCLKFIESLGLKAKVAKYEELIDSSHEFCSNSIDYRLDSLVNALKAADSKAVWCMAGGYGSYQLLEKLDAVAPLKQKLFIGFSDITVLLNYFAEKWGWVTLHGPMLKNLGKGELSEEAIADLKDIIFGKKDVIKIKQIKSFNKTAEKNGEVKGRLFGGCLSLMQSLTGTAQDIDYKGKILLLEDDRFETPARISRILDQMLRAGVFDKVKAVILGSFLEKESSENKALNYALARLAKELDKQNKPLLWGKNLGHCPDMEPLLIGAEIEIKTGEKPEVSEKVVGSVL